MKNTLEKRRDMKTEEIKVTQTEEGLQVAVSASLSTALSMVVALVFALAKEAEMEIESVLEILGQVIGEVEADQVQREEDDTLDALGELQLLALPLRDWLSENAESGAYIVIEEDVKVVVPIAEKSLKNKL